MPFAPDYWLARVFEHFVNVYTFDLGRYLIAASGLALLLWLLGDWSEERRIQKRRATSHDYRREILSSFRTVFFFGLTGLSTLLMIEAQVIPVHQGDFSRWQFAGQLVAIILAHDTWFYWMHRALHHPRLFRATHLHHHRSRTPTPWAAYSFSVCEGIAEAAFIPAFLLTAALAGVAYIDLAIFAFLAWMIFRNVIGHAGVELHPAGWVDTPWLDWLTTTTHHDLHHSEGRHNFGLYFTWWDRWMCTEHPHYKKRFREVARPIASREAGARIAGFLIAAAVSLSVIFSPVGVLAHAGML